MTSIRFKSKIKKLEHLSGHYLDVPSLIVKKLGGMNKTRYVCTVNNSMTWQCGLVAHKKGGAYILLNQKLMKQGNLETGSSASVLLKKDSSKFGMAMPAELQELLSQDREGRERFESLVAGKRRYIIYYVSKVKQETLRLERAVRCITNLKRLPKGKESFAGILSRE